MSSPPAQTAPSEETHSNSTEAQTLPEYETLVTSLRATLTTSQTLLQTQSTRLAQLVDLEAETTQLKDQLTFLSAAKEAVELQLKEETKRREVAEENVEMLRGQVEQARRGVMVLQKQEKERKRASMLPTVGLGLGGGGFGVGAGTSEGEEVLSDTQAKLNKRQSIMGRGHRRVSSQSEPSELHSAMISGPSTSPNLAVSALLPARAGGLRELRLGSGASSSQVTSPPPTSPYFEDVPMSGRSMSFGDNNEAQRLRFELVEMQKKLDDSEEARMASEVCLKALREFMAGSNSATDPYDEGGMTESTQNLLKGIRLPPLPTDREEDDQGTRKEDTKKPIGAGAGWGFKLFSKSPIPGPNPTSPALSTAVEPPITPQPLSPPTQPTSLPTTMTASAADGPTEGTLANLSLGTTPLGNFVSGWNKTVQPGTPQPPPPPGRLTSFFSRKNVKEKDLPLAPSDTDGRERSEGGMVVEEDGAALEPSPVIEETGGESGEVHIPAVEFKEREASPKVV